MARIQENQKDEAAKQKVKEDLDICLAEYKGELTKALQELENFNNLDASL